MICVYVDNIVVVSSKARDAIQQVTEVFTAKEGSAGVPERYLGADIEKIQAADGRMVWSTSPCLYIKNAAHIIEDLFVEDGFDGGLKKKSSCRSIRLPRAGHLEVLYHMFTYLKSHPDMGRLVYNPKEPMVDESIFNGNADWTYFMVMLRRNFLPGCQLQGGA
eukprot:5109953-Ditylum_brightwellii.AAC.1